MTVFTIPSEVSFVDSLAAGLLAETAGDPLALSAMQILLPTRRACRGLAEAFLRQADGRPLLLPRLQPLGDAEEDELLLAGDLDIPPAIPPLARQLLLARLIIGLGGGRGGRPPTPEQAARLAGELGRLLDQVTTEELTFDGLTRLVPENLARHWQITVDFLAILTEHWPKILAEQGWTDAADRRNRLLTAQAAQWKATPPAGPVLAAGSTGSIPATARLLKVIARLPGGRLVLPGLDRRMGEADRAALDPSHPQWGLMQLLAGLDLRPADVALWPGCGEAPGSRARLIAEVMRPAATTDAWRELAGRRFDLSGLARLDCPAPREEAAAIALMMRETLETPGRTAALVTADRPLARRVAAELGRFAIDIDDSAGRPLDLTPLGSYLLLVARMVAEGFAPHATLAALKSPLARGGLPPGVLRARVRRLELAALRGPRPGPGIDGLLAAVGERPELTAWLAQLQQMAGPLAALMQAPAAPLTDMLTAHLALAERLADTPDEAGSSILWRGEGGRAAARFAADLTLAADSFPPLDGRAYPGLLRHLMAGVPVRPAWGHHPRLAIWGPLEARLQHADLLILGGLNEGVWPPEPDADPWMSRPMRQAFGLAPPERRIGLAAHDFAQGAAAPRVVLTRSLRVDGTPTRPSRWLLRLDAVLQALGGPTAAAALAPGGDWLAWQTALDRPAAIIRLPPPAPTPPLVARPKQLSATQIETWMRDPYGIYARKILGLEALDPIDADPGASDYGSVVHETLDAFLRAHSAGPLPADALERLLAEGRRRFAGLAARPGQAAFWWPRFESTAHWFIAQESERRPLVVRSWSEVSGRLPLPGVDFTVTATADRIDLLSDGRLAIIDYKTGSPPKAREVAAGFAPQLPIEAAIAAHGGFADIPAKPIGGLLYWRLAGGAEGGIETSVGGEDSQAMAERALEGLTDLVRVFSDPATPYAARPHPEMAPRYSDYQHLARVREWAGGDDGDE